VYRKGRVGQAISLYRGQIKRTTETLSSNIRGGDVLFSTYVTCPKYSQNTSFANKEGQKALKYVCCALHSIEICYKLFAKTLQTYMH